MAFRVFVRNWYRREGGRLVPNTNGRKVTLRVVKTEEEARSYCRVYNANNDPGPLSRKAEYMGA